MTTIANCPSCQTKTHVIDSRAYDHKNYLRSLRRRRKCPVCNYRYTTYEISKNDLLAIDEKIKQVNELSRTMAALIEVTSE